MSIIDLIEKSINTCFARIPRTKPAITQVNNARLIAHRGAHNKQFNCIENTDAAFARALKLGCWGIEFDVHATADNILVVNHDPDLNRLWNKSYSINKLIFAQLRELAPEVPSLDEVISRYGKRMHLFIELKAPFHAEEALQTALQSLTVCEDYHLLTLDESVFAALERFPRQSLLLVAEYKNVAEFCRLSLAKGYGGVLGHYLLFNNKKLNQLKVARQKTGLGFVDSKNSLYREINRGLPWLFTNNVDEVSGYLRDLRAFYTDLRDVPN